MVGTAPATPLLGEDAVDVIEQEMRDLDTVSMPDDRAYRDDARAIRDRLEPPVAALVAEQRKAERERLAEAYWAMGLCGAAAIGGWQSLLSHSDCPDQGAAMVDREAFHRFMDLLQGRAS